MKAKESLQTQYYDEMKNILIENEEDYPYIIPNTSDYVMNFGANENALDLKSINIGPIKGATVDKIVEWIGGQKCLEIRDFVIITYDNYISGIELLKKIIKRFMIPWPMAMSTKEVGEMLKERYKIIQNKILGFLQHWITLKWNDFTMNKKLRIMIDTWLKYMEINTEYYSLNKKQIEEQIKPILKRADDHNKIVSIHEIGANFNPEKCPLPLAIIPYNSLVYGAGLLSYSSELIAMQLALIDQELFCKLNSKDILLKQSKKKNKPYSMQRLTDRHNFFSNFVILYILKDPSPNIRDALFDKFFEIGKISKELHNINCAFIIHSALSSYSDTFERTCPKATAKNKKQMDEDSKLFSTDNNFSIMREYIRNLEQPCIPCFHLWSKDMDTISEMYPNDYFDKEKGMINMIRQVIIADRMKELESFQKVRYVYYKLPSLFNFLKYDYLASFPLLMDPKYLLDPLKFLNTLRLL